MLFELMPVLDVFLTSSRRLAIFVLASALLLPTVAQASVLCSMASKRVAQKCPCAHAEGEDEHADESTTISSASCCSVETSTVASSAKAPAPLDAGLSVLELPPGRVVIRAPAMSAPPMPQRPHQRVERPPPTGPPLFLLHQSFLN